MPFEHAASRHRGVEVEHSTLSRWVHKYATELDKRCRPYLKLTNDSWRVDETYIKVKGEDKYPEPSASSAPEFHQSAVGQTV